MCTPSADATSADGDDGDTQSDVPETVPSLKPPEVRICSA